MEFVYAIVSVIIVSLISLLVAIPFFLKKNIGKSSLMFLLSISVGTLLGGVFLHFLPEAIHEEGYKLSIGLLVLLGFLAFFLLEKLIHHHHNHKKIKGVEKEVHSHGFSIAPLNLIGDGVHNFIDGLVIAGSYMVSIHLGIAATIAVIFHEIPQEVADFGVLLYSGWSKKKALLFNFFSAAAAILGTIIGFLFVSEEFIHFIIPFAAGSFLYIAAANLTPELHKHCSSKDTVLHVLAIILGISIMVGLLFLGVGH